MLKIKISIVSLLFLSAPVSADVEICTEYADLAERIMQIRQDGVPLSEVLSVGSEPEVKELIKTLALIAYKSPRFYGEDAKGIAVSEFSNKVLLQCLGQFGESF
jgi:hypothetical protein